MKRRDVLFFTACVLLLAAGCAKKSRMAASSSSSFFENSGPMAKLVTEVSAASLQRFIAVRHRLDVVSPESELPRAWESVVNFCGTIQCEVIASSITNRTNFAAPSGSMTARVSPDDLKKLLAYVEKQGRIAKHTTENVNKTTEVVDSEAKIKNLTTFRDNF